jgi:hypothetical protein
LFVFVFCFSKLTLCQLVLVILAAVCLYFDAKPPGHRQVTDALENYRATKNEKGRFETIVQVRAKRCVAKFFIHVLDRA